jgi:hypothetical protein
MQATNFQLAGIGRNATCLWVSEAAMTTVWDKEREWNRSMVISRETGFPPQLDEAGATADIQLL